MSRHQRWKNQYSILQVLLVSPTLTSCPSWSSWGLALLSTPRASAPAAAFTLFWFVSWSLLLLPCCLSSLRTGMAPQNGVASHNQDLIPHHRAGCFQKTRKVLVVINTSVLSGKQEVLQGVDFFFRSFGTGDPGRPAHGLADTSPDEAIIWKKRGLSS